MPLPLLAIAAGAEALKLGSNLLTARSARKRAEKIKRQQLEALRPAEQRLSQLNVGPSQSEGSLLQALTQRTLMSLAQRGVLQGSGAAGEVAAAVAPVEQQRQQHIDELTFRLAAIKQSIFGGSDSPGLGDAFAQSLGSAGNTLGYLAGRKYASNLDTSSDAGAQTGTAYDSGFQSQDQLRTLDPSIYDSEDPLQAAQLGRAKQRRVRR